MKINTFCLVLSAQRSGSTLFCRKLANIGGLGVPDEYALKLIRSNLKITDETFQQSLEEYSYKSIQGNSCGLKIMLDYSHKLISHLIPSTRTLRPGESRLDCVQEISNFIDYLEVNFDKTAFFILSRRNCVELAVSRASSIYNGKEKRHNLAGKNLFADDFLEITDESFVFDKILDRLPKAIREISLLTEVAEKISSKAIHIQYEDLINEEDCVTTKITKYLTRRGITTEDPTAFSQETGLFKVLNPLKQKELSSKFTMKMLESI